MLHMHLVGFVCISCLFASVQCFHSSATTPTPLKAAYLLNVRTPGPSVDPSSDPTTTHQHLPCTRRTFTRVLIGAFTLTGINVDQVALAAKASYPPGTIFRSGKAPQIPGGKPQSKDDVSGTRKDPNFLRSVADCKNKCENTLDADGRTRTKEECLSECQDICCTTYEQCTFAIVPRI